MWVEIRGVAIGGDVGDRLPPPTPTQLKWAKMEQTSKKNVDV